jgi:hypothetical protein
MLLALFVVINAKFPDVIISIKVKATFAVEGSATIETILSSKQ